MRPDMSKVVVERPRYGSGSLKYKDHRTRTAGRSADDLDDLSRTEGMFPKRAREWKSFTDLLGPLRRFVASRVGSRWDDVFSEISENLRPSSTTQQHVIDHLMRWVDTKVARGHDGKLYAMDGSPREVAYSDFYVDPDGILREGGREIYYYRHMRDRPVPPVTKKVVGHEQELRKVDGIWYWAVWSDAPKPYLANHRNADGTVDTSRPPYLVHPPVHDCFGEGTRDGRFRSGKRQANGRDLRRHGLSNDVPEDVK